MIRSPTHIYVCTLAGFIETHTRPAVIIRHAVCSDERVKITLTICTLLYILYLFRRIRANTGFFLSLFVFTLQVKTGCKDANIGIGKK